MSFWVAVILAYYLLATLLPIDKLIGKIYPVFGIVLIVMVIGVGGGILLQGYQIPELTLQNLHPAGKPVWPFLFITVACGAVSGFHATQSPMMARCMKREKDGRRIFYGAMISEGVIALTWAAAGVAFYGSTGGLQAALANMGQSGVVYDISTSLLGIAGGALGGNRRGGLPCHVRGHGLSQRQADPRRLVSYRPGANQEAVTAHRPAPARRGMPHAA